MPTVSSVSGAPPFEHSLDLTQIECQKPTELATFLTWFAYVRRSRTRRRARSSAGRRRRSLRTTTRRSRHGSNISPTTATTLRSVISSGSTIRRRSRPSTRSRAARRCGVSHSGRQTRSSTTTARPRPCGARSPRSAGATPQLSHEVAPYGDCVLARLSVQAEHRPRRSLVSRAAQTRSDTSAVTSPRSERHCPFGSPLF